MERGQFEEIIRNKWVVFDTNILIKSFTSENFEKFKVFFDYLKNNNCEIVNFDLVGFEFTRNDYCPSDIAHKEIFLKKIGAILLNFNHAPDLLEEALEISRIYSHKGIQKGKISLVDCCLGALLKIYNKNIFLATLNHKDFPTILFDRKFIFPIDADDDIHTIAFYRFNNNKWATLKNDFDKIQQSQ